MVSGLTTLLAVFVLQIPSLNTADMAKALDWVFMIFLPNYCLGKSLMDMYTNYEFNHICEQLNYKLVCQFIPTMPCCKGIYFVFYVCVIIIIVNIICINIIIMYCYITYGILSIIINSSNSSIIVIIFIIIL
jgi:hypothetical protein